MKGTRRPRRRESYERPRHSLTLGGRASCSPQDLTVTFLLLAAGAVVVLAFDTLGSLASRHWKFSYAVLAPGSILIWSMTAAVVTTVAQAGVVESVGLGAVSGAWVALVEATLGWWISWVIGPGELPAELRSRRVIGRVVFRATLTGLVVGAVVGGVISLVAT